MSESRQSNIIQFPTGRVGQLRFTPGEKLADHLSEFLDGDYVKKMGGKALFLYSEKYDVLQTSSRQLMGEKDRNPTAETSAANLQRATQQYGKKSQRLTRTLGFKANGRKDMYIKLGVQPHELLKSSLVESEYGKGGYLATYVYLPFEHLATGRLDRARDNLADFVLGADRSDYFGPNKTSLSPNHDAVVVETDYITRPLH